MNRYEEKKQRRIDYYNQKAVRHAQSGRQLQNDSVDMIAAIPAGRPILVGHHSELHHRRDLEKSDSKMRKGFEEIGKAEYYAYKAEAAENNNAISSDDPEAIKKIKERIEHLEEKQTFMKDANKYYKKHNSFVGFQGMAEEKSAELIGKLNFEFGLYGKPYPPYALSNNSANIRRLKDRLKGLESRDQMLEEKEGWTFDGGKVHYNQEENRIQVLFDDIPDEELRKKLKSNGFRWSRYHKAWQRQINANGIRAAKRISEIAPIKEDAA